MLTRRGFIIAGGSTLAAAATASGAFAGLSQAPRTLTVYSQALAPRVVQGSDIVLTRDLAASLVRFESLIAAQAATPVTFVLDAADTVVLDIAQTRVATPARAGGRAAV